MEWVLLVCFLIRMGTFGSMPSFEDLENQTLTLHQIISADGVVLGNFEKQVSIHYADLPKNLVQALIATEDARFMSILEEEDLRAISSLGTSGGASTLTQQLAKLFTEKDLNFFRLQK
jgi:penicillin-binding protein 1A